MSKFIKRIVIVGGGTAGWLSAAIIAAKHHMGRNQGFSITLVESSDIPTVGVGEGTWPTMKNTLREIGLKEADVFKRCAAAFKQGGKFVNWVHGNGDFYYHPFTVPLGYGRIDLAPYIDNIEDYAVETNFQHHVCEAGLAPRTANEKEYQSQCNYAYHLDAGAFATVLKEHCLETFGVQHKIASVGNVVLDESGAIDHLVYQDGSEERADLFVDCTGFASLLLGKAMGVDFINTDDVLFNNRALAVHVPYDGPDSPVATHTIATGQKAGWIWDIGLTTRRGVGHVFSTDYISEDEAESVLRDYIGNDHQDYAVRQIKFNSGYRSTFWKKNCVAIGLSAGFVEPLEATALMLIEISARYVADQLPANEAVMGIVARRFNEQMRYRWRRIIDFLKLHYMLTQRPEPYWQAHRNPDSIPQSLLDDLEMWRYRGPISSDFDAVIELFPAASYQYVLYGMGFKPDFSAQPHLYQQSAQAQQIIEQNRRLTTQMLQSLPTHREYIEHWLKLAS
jgi:flavin-dependent dehydrogenase